MAETLDTRDVSPTQRRAVFFGLDKTMIPGSSLFLLAQGLHQRNYYRTGQILGFAWEHLLFRAGASETSPRLENAKVAALSFVAGRPRPEMVSLVREIAHERIVPAVFPDIAELIERYRSDGYLTYVATAAPEELAEEVAQGLGMTGSLGTRAEVDDAERYSGRLAGSLLQGPAKASAVAERASAEGIDLSMSAAFSDSINDLPLLELVGRPEVVNPDHLLLRVASQRGWPVHELRDATRAQRRPAPPPPVPHRVAELGLSEEVRPEGMAFRGRTHHFSVSDPDALVRELEATGRFRRDSRLGRIFHRGEISLREVSPRHSLHITLDKDNRVSAHVDRYSPLAPSQPEHGCKYSLARVAAHNVAGMAADLSSLLPRRRRHERPGSSE